MPINNNSYLQPIVLLVIYLLFSASTIAASNSDKNKKTPWFEIEVIIFANHNQEGLNSESWPERTETDPHFQAVTLKFPSRLGVSNRSSGIINAGGLVRYDASGSPIESDYYSNDPIADIYADGAYTFLAKSGFRLGGIYRRLTKSSAYDPLLHIAWRQPTVGKKQALPVIIYEGMTIPDSVWLKSNRADTAPTSGRFNPYANSTPSYVTEQEANMGPKPMRLFGTIRLSVSRYLHVYTDLHLKIPLIEETEVLQDDVYSSTDAFFSGSSESQPRMISRNVYREFTLSESRRMRSTEVHHLDHPLFALIVLVTPYQLPVEEPILEAQPISVPAKNPPKR